MKQPVALTIAGSDPSGGAGIQADLKTFHRFGVYGMSVISLITVQNTLGVSQVYSLPAGLVKDQLHSVLSDITPQAVKTGAFDDPAGIQAVAEELNNFQGLLIIDPVMTSSHGKAFLGDQARKQLIEQLLPQAFLITPNLAEAEWLSGIPFSEKNDFEKMARAIQALGVPNVLIKGGHLSDTAADCLVSGEKVLWVDGVRVPGKNTHGTGCTLSAAVTALLAKGTALENAVKQAKLFVTEAIREAPELGKGIGPLNHWAGLSKD